MSMSELAAAHGLKRVGARPRLGSYLRQVWERRQFIVTMARYRISVENQNNRLGAVWLFLKPLLNALVYGLIFGVLQGGNRPDDYAAYVVIGVFLYEFFSKCFSQGAKAITGNRFLVQSLAFPRIALPLAVAVQELLNLGPMLGVMALVLMVLGHWPTWEWLLLPVLLISYTLFNTGVAFITARLTVHFRDLTQVLPFISRILFYTSGVLFNVNKLFAGHPSVIALFNWHPIYQVLDIARSLLMTHAPYNPMYWLYTALWGVGTVLGGFVFFWVAEERYGRE